MNAERSHDEIPVIIFHLGRKEYPKYCIDHALEYKNKIIFITDNKEYYRSNHINNDMLTIIDMGDYPQFLGDSCKLRKIYKHFSSNSYTLEYICILRWIIIYEVMKDRNIERAFICDSDVLIYDSISEINNKFLKDYNYMLCTSSSKNVTGGQSIWNIQILKLFVDFIFKFYETQVPSIEAFFKTYNEAGGICDMTLLYYFCHNKTEFVGLRLPDFPYFENDLTQIFNDEFTFDLHLRTLGSHIHKDEYKMNHTTGNKDIEFIKNKVYCYNTRLKKKIRFILLHFQGTNKRYMKSYFENSFKNKLI
jgi:hypothetical protein